MDRGPWTEHRSGDPRTEAAASERGSRAEQASARPGVGTTWGARPPWSPAPSTGRRPGSVPVLAAAVLLVTALGAGLGYGLWQFVSSQSQLIQPTITGSPQGSSAPGAPPNAASLAAATAPALVNINVTQPSQGLQGAGSGMVLGQGGEVLTNNHVISGASTISVTDIGNGRTYGASVLGYDRTADVAVLQLTGASGLQVVNVGDSSRTTVDDGVVAVGNGQGTGGMPSYAAGVVTATDQSITAQDQANGTPERLSGLIATNAGVVAGDSGGALVGTPGRVVGMVTAGSENFQFQGQGGAGYAIPINQALTVADQIEAGRASATVHIGPTPYLGVLVQSNGGTGATIAQVIGDSPADHAGLTEGDTIVAINDHNVSSPEDLTATLLNEEPGARLQVTYLDPTGAQHTTSVTLGSGPPQ